MASLSKAFDSGKSKTSQLKKPTTTKPAARKPNPAQGSGASSYLEKTSARGSRTGVRPGPSQRLGFVQGGLLFQNRDDVDEYKPYYEVFSSGKVEFIPAYTGAGQHEVIDPDGTRRFSPWSIFGGHGDVRRGRANNGTELSPEVLASFAVAVEAVTGGDIPVRDPSTGADAYQMFMQLEEQRRSLKPGQDLKDTEYVKLLQEQYGGGQDDFANKATGMAGLTSVGGGGSSPLGSGGSGGGGGSYTGSAAGGDRRGGIGGDFGAGGFGGVSLPPGKDGDSVITQDVLNEFLESNFSYAFNAMINQHRDAGAASVFLRFLDEQFFRYQNEYLGTLGQQALDGKVPTGSWTNFLVQKGLMPQNAASLSSASGPIAQFAGMTNQPSQPGTAAAAPAAASGTGSQAGAAPATIGQDNIMALLGVS